MKISVEEKRQEALERLEILKKKGMTYTAPIRHFKNGDEIGIFENQGGGARAVYYGLRMNQGDGDFYDKLGGFVDEFEKKNDAVVYLIQVSHLTFGTMCSLFYVSDHKNEWKADRKDLEEGYPMVYVYNMDDEFCSEAGTIGYAADPLFGGIYRTA